MALPWLSVVIPVYNEATGIKKTIQMVDRFLAGQGEPYEIIVVDDGSSDGTSAVIHLLQQKNPCLRLVKNRANMGKGAAVRRGMLTARGRWHLFCDADLSAPIEEVNNLLPLLKQGYPVVIGSRALPGSRLLHRQPWWREMLGRLFNLLVRLTCLPGIRDSQCGFKLFDRQASRAVFSRQTIAGFAFDVEILCISRKLGLPVAEVPVTWADSRASTVKVIRDGARMLADLWRIKTGYSFPKPSQWKGLPES